MSDLNKLIGIGPKTVSKLKILGISNLFDLLNHFPSRYIDFSQTRSITEAPINENSTIAGTVTQFNNVYSRSGKNIQKATLKDATGTISLLWFNQPFLNKILTIGSLHAFAGTVTLYQGKKTIIAPIRGPYNTGKIIGVYPETSGLTSNWFRKSIQQNIDLLLQSITENLLPSIITKYKITSLLRAYQDIHSPPNQRALESARFRLSLQEMLSIQATTHLQKKSWFELAPPHLIKPSKKINQFIETLPFKLTASQVQSWKEIESDLTSPTKVMNRLLLGDVGSGKTIVAILAALTTHLSHHQTIIIAPTQILAKQHWDTFTRHLKDTNIKISLLSSTDKLSAKEIAHTHIVVATHAALFKSANLYDKVGLVIIDEQHKFGVKQRSFFQHGVTMPHTLTMTATPIPRTISLTLLGNLDLSYINELPQNRLPIKTFLVPTAKQNKCYQWVENQIITTHAQVFFVCPFIEMSESNKTIKAAKVEYDILSKNVFPHLKLALIHGQTKSDQRQSILSNFKKNKISILVTTPIIEVGIDFPNATIMIIQSAERFGLAQLHQLRGRVGRGDCQSYCYLFTETQSDLASRRLNFLETHHLGRDIAEYDLKLRGPGELFSYLQHGFPSLKLADLSDIDMINLSKKIIFDLIDSNPDFDLHRLIPSFSDHSDQISSN